MSSTGIGQQAEQAACEYLRRQGYEVIARNWKTRVCEIDIVAKQARTVSFVEVKYRASDQQGSGLDYVTRVKLRRMRFAAEAWLLEHQWDGDITLAAIEVCAPDFAIGEFVASIDVD